MRLPRLKRLFETPDWDRIELNGADGRTVAIGPGQHWYFEGPDRVLGVILGPHATIEIDVAQIVSVRVLEPEVPAHEGYVSAGI